MANLAIKLPTKNYNCEKKSNLMKKTSIIKILKLEFPIIIDLLKNR